MSDTTELVDLAVSSLIWRLNSNTPVLITSQVKLFTSKRVVCYTRMRLPRWRKVSVSPSYPGLQLVIYDAYRPTSNSHVEACPDPQYVVDVTVGLNHSRGTAISRRMLS